jgi:hypothetical protein
MTNDPPFLLVPHVPTMLLGQSRATADRPADSDRCSARPERGSAVVDFPEIDEEPKKKLVDKM